MLGSGEISLIVKGAKNLLQTIGLTPGAFLSDAAAPPRVSHPAHETKAVFSNGEPVGNGESQSNEGKAVDFGAEHLM